MSTLPLPARSLRDRLTSLRTVPDGAGCLLCKTLISRALLVMRLAISAVEPIFLPALRERGQGGECLLLCRQTAAKAGYTGMRRRERYDGDAQLSRRAKRALHLEIQRRYRDP